MVVTWLIFVIVLQEYVSGDRGDVWKESIAVQSNSRQKTVWRAPCRKNLRASLMEASIISAPGAFVGLEESYVYDSTFPETVYPVSIIDSAQPYYFLTEAHDHILGPFSRDVKKSFKCITDPCPEPESTTLDSGSCFYSTRNKEGEPSKEASSLVNTSKEEDRIREVQRAYVIETSNENINNPIPKILHKNLEDITLTNHVTDEIDSFNASNDVGNLTNEGEYMTLMSQSIIINDTISDTFSYDDQIITPPLFYEYAESENATSTIQVTEDENTSYYSENYISVYNATENDILSTSYVKPGNYSNNDFATESAVTISPDY